MVAGMLAQVIGATGMALVVALLAASWVEVAEAGTRWTGSGSAGDGRAELSATAAGSCVVRSEGDLLQGSGPEVYVYVGGVLRAIPDRETLRSLGYDPNGVDPIRDECLREMRFGEPIPSVRAGGAVDRPAPPAPGARAEVETWPVVVTLEASRVQAPRGGRVLLIARTPWPEGGAFVLTIRQTDGPGGGPRSALVTGCHGMVTCTAEVQADEPATWTYTATLYRCTSPGACVAEQDSSSVSVTWQ